MSGGALWHVTMSLDGFIAGAEHDMSALFAAGATGAEGAVAAAEPMGNDIIDSVGAILAGRRWLDHAVLHWNGRAGIYGGAWDGPVIVLTHHPETAPNDDPGITTMSATIEDAMSAAQRAAGAK